ncbi:MAG: hypothetical protein IPN69_18820 [Acidobacteria bacterium]|nr:hypothetical protein [Acidobacteriota bacterium]MBK8812765.1 hypothetical protein [Acidobacteriota bacterium]
MKLSEVKTVLELGPIIEDGSSRPPIRFKASILHGVLVEDEDLRLFVEESDRFVGPFNSSNEEIEVFCASGAIFWERVCGKTESEVIGNLMEDIQQSWTSAEMAKLKAQEIVKTYEFDVTDESGYDDTLRIRVEILKLLSPTPVYTTQTFYLRYYDLIPTFPVEGLSHPVSIGVYVCENHPSLGGITGESIDAVTEKLMVASHCFSRRIE